MELSAEQMLEKFSANKEHAHSVCEYSLTIFDGVNSTFKELTEKHRRMLQCASLLHDIGYCVEEKNHNKHSQKLILEHELEGFSQKQKEMISCLCRYHRGSLPDKKEHDVYCNFDKKERKTVKRLGGILKIADGLAHIEHIKNIEIKYDETNNINEFIITPKSRDFYPDLSYVIKKKDLFESGFKTQVVFKFDM